MMKMRLKMVLSKFNLRAVIFLLFIMYGLIVLANDKDKKQQVYQLDKSVMTDAYWDLWNKEIQDAIDKNIEKYRKANALVKLKGVEKGTEVKVQHVTHDFQFGANIFNFDQLGSTQLNNKYKELFGTLFNSATIPFYWKTFEPEPGKPRYKSSVEDSANYWNGLKEPWKDYRWRRPSPEKIIEFCEGKGIHMHGHPLIWGNTTWNHPTWISKDAEKVDEMERLFEKRITEICRYYQGRIPSWDIVNESVDPEPGKPRYGIIPNDYTFKSFKQAEELFPSSVKLCINDSWRAVYPPFIKGLMSRGAKIDIVGLQMHIFDSGSCSAISEGKTVFPNGTSWKPMDVINYLQILDSLDRPIHLSEITIQSPGDGPKDDQVQANIARNMYRLWFSWPSIYKITWWNLVDDCGASGEPTRSGLFTRQMEPKPSFFALNDLINNEWKTQMTIKVDKNGSAKFRGFKGKYKVSWKDKSGNEQQGEFYLTKDGDGLMK